MQEGTSKDLLHWEQRGLGHGPTLHRHGLQDVQTRLFVSFRSLLFTFGRHPIPPSSITTQMDQVVDLDSPTTWARVIAKRATLFKRLCPWPWRTCPLHSIETPYDMHTLEVVVINPRWDNLMFVILYIFSSNLMILYTFLLVALSWRLKRSCLHVCWNCKELTDAQFEIIPKIVHPATCQTWILPSSRQLGFPPLNYPCQVCQRIDDVDQMLVWDNCNGGYHLFCFKPELTQVLTDIWYCSSCFHATLWFLLKPCHIFLGSGLGGDTWEFHFSLLLCIVYILCVHIFLVD
jgi:hypothetical protein